MTTDNTKSRTYPLPMFEDNACSGGPLSFSKVGKFQRCPQKYYLHYLAGIRKTYREERFFVGSAVHAFLEGAALSKVELEDRSTLWANFCKGQEWLDAYLDGHVKQLGGAENLTGDYWDDLIAMRDEALLIGARAWHFFKPHEWEIFHVNGVPLIEYEFRINTAEETSEAFPEFIGYADLVARHKPTQSMWLIDYKTRVSAFTTYEIEEHGTQFALYQYCLNKLGLNVEGTITFQCLDKLPEPPKMLKSGKLSRAKNQNCDWETYKDFVIRAGLDLNDYLDMREVLAGKEYFRFTKNYRHQREVERIWRDFLAIARTMAACHDVADCTTPEEGFPRHMKGGHMGCSKCDYGELCLEDLRGGDIDYLLQTRYARKGEDSIIAQHKTEVSIEWD